MKRPFTWGYYDDLGRECATCKTYKEYSFFHRHSSCPNGYNTVCKDCRKGASKRQYCNISTEKLLYGRAKSRAARQSVPFDIELSDIKIPDKCPILGIEFSKRDVDAAPSLDKIIPDKGYVKGNIQVISNKANRMKSNASIEELKLFSKWVCEIL